MRAASGIPRKVDELGRIVLPVELRRLLHIRPGDELEISAEGGSLRLRKVEVRCVFCDGAEALRPYREKQLCATCATGIASSASG